MSYGQFVANLKYTISQTWKLCHKRKQQNSICFELILTQSYPLGHLGGVPSGQKIYQTIAGSRFQDLGKEGARTGLFTLNLR
jgi:hypothetical protein